MSHFVELPPLPLDDQQHDGILPDKYIQHYADTCEMIAPFHGDLVRQVNDVRILSKGLSSFGYDVSLTENVKIFTNTNGCILDPKNLDQKSMVDAEVFKTDDGCSYVIIPPNSYMLGVTVEYFKIPNDIMVLCVGKSTYARIGAIVNVTPVEPGFHGNVVIEIANTTTLPMKIYLGEGIAQFLFFKSKHTCNKSYADGNRKYQGQTSLTMAKV